MNRIHILSRFCRAALPGPRVLLVLWVVLAPALRPVSAQTVESPDVLMQHTAQTMFKAIEHDQANLSRHPQQVYALVERVLVPHVDFNRAAHWVLGHYWRQASRTQRARFVAQFHTLLVRFYSNALMALLGTNGFSADMLRFLPYTHVSGAREAVVRSLIRQPNGTEVQVDYILHHGRAGWQVYDVTVEGISLIITYRSSFAAEIRKNGLNGLILTLARHNRQLLAVDR